MALVTNFSPPGAASAQYIASRRLWLTADKSRIVEDGDPAAAFLLCGAGAAVSAEDVARYGLARVVTPAPVFDAITHHEDMHGGETPEQARQARERMFA